MKIIKKGSIEKKLGRRTCPHCNTIFEHEKEDIKTHYDIEDEQSWYIICPYCKEYINVKYAEFLKFCK